MNKQDLSRLINKQAPTVLDIGCYDGKDSKELSDILDCRVHCFEPDPLSQEMFRLVHEGNKKLILHSHALSNTDGEIDFYQSNHPQSNSILEPKLHLNVFPGVIFDEVMKVRSMKLDTWYEEYLTIGRVIDFIWADVNGGERELILGGLTALKYTRYLYIEVSKKELYAGQPHHNFIDSLLPDFRALAMLNWGENFGNVLLKNTLL